MADTATFAPFFSVRSAKPSLRRYRATWPCGSTWDFDRESLDVPIYRNGEQIGCSILADTLGEMISELRCEGAEVVRL